MPNTAAERVRESATREVPSLITYQWREGRIIRSLCCLLLPWGQMCRNIKTLFNFDPPVTPEEIRAASLQFVRKISGFNKPSKANESTFLVQSMK